MSHYPAIGVIALAVAVLLITHDQDAQQADLDQLRARVQQLETPRAVPSRATRTRPQAPALLPAAPSHLPRSRVQGNGQQRGLTLDVTCYCWTGNRTASGVWPRVGMAASNTHPFGTRLRVEGVGVVTVTDRIGHSSELDIFYADRDACLRFGRRSLDVAVVR